MSDEVENVVPLKRKETKPPPGLSQEERARRFWWLENHICELVTAAELAIDIYTGYGDPRNGEEIGPKTAWVLDQIERLAKELKAMYYDEELEED
jgi:hypothetical protein